MPRISHQQFLRILREQIQEYEDAGVRIPPEFTPLAAWAFQFSSSCGLEECRAEHPSGFGIVAFQEGSARISVMRENSWDAGRVSVILSKDQIINLITDLQECVNFLSQTEAGVIVGG